jgi:glycosyltransferase involved in cell wall biosynthesis
MLSVILICKDEEEDIEACLDALTWADELVVVDAYSSDRTPELVGRYTQHLFQRQWTGFGAQKQFALEQARGDWVLSIDADERVSEALAREIQETLKAPSWDGYEIPRRSSYCGQAIRFGGWQSDRVLRLFRRERARFSQDLVHERVILEGSLGQLKQPLQHNAFRDHHEVLDKLNRYSSLWAEQHRDRPLPLPLTQAILRGLWAFLRTWLLRGAILDGRGGLMLALSNAGGVYYKYVKLGHLRRQGGDAKP